MLREGKYHYQHLDPVFVSGLIAESAQERRAMAELFYHQELKRSAQLTAFIAAYGDVGRNVRGDNPIVSTDRLSGVYGRDITQWREASASVTPVVGDRLTTFVNKSCGDTCKSAFLDYLSRIGGDLPIGIAIDVYFIGYSEKEISEWAASIQLSPEAVKAGTVTLNFDDRYELFQSPALPAFYLVRDNRVLGQL
jgi:integrating conjugative element protein (TIGR03759 family)